MKSKEHILGVIYWVAGKSPLNESREALHGFLQQRLPIQ
jgi:hypothetical protein